MVQTLVGGGGGGGAVSSVWGWGRAATTEAKARAAMSLNCMFTGTEKLVACWLVDVVARTS